MGVANLRAILHALRSSGGATSHPLVERKGPKMRAPINDIHIGRRRFLRLLSGRSADLRRRQAETPGRRHGTDRSVARANPEGKQQHSGRRSPRIERSPCELGTPGASLLNGNGPGRGRGCRVGCTDEPGTLLTYRYMTLRMCFGSAGRLCPAHSGVAEIASPGLPGAVNRFGKAKFHETEKS